MAGELARWTVTPHVARNANLLRNNVTQSETFGPLLAMGIDGVDVIFPAAWNEDVFNASLELVEGLPFHDVNTFKIFIKGRLAAELGNSRLDTFQARCDLANLHLPGSLQTQILYNGSEDLESFFAFIVANTKQVLLGQVIVARRGGAAAAPAGLGAGAASAPDMWACPTCTFNNRCPSPKCEICGEPRPAGFCSSSGGRRRKTIRKHKKSKKTRKQRKRTV